MVVGLADRYFEVLMDEWVFSELVNVDLFLLGLPFAEEKRGILE